jgi:uncharacterized protein (UPF0332 family)
MVIEKLNSLLKEAVDAYAWDDVKSLLKQGANIDANNGYALFSAVWQNNIKMVKYLVESPELDKHANLYYEDNKIMLTCVNYKSRFLPTLDYLLSKGLDVHHNDNEGLIKAVKAHNLEAVKLLMRYTKQSIVDDMSLFIAAVHTIERKKTDYSVLDYLLDNGIDVNHHSGLILRNALNSEQYELTDFLLTKGASLDIAYDYNEEYCYNDDVKKRIENYKSKISLDHELNNKKQSKSEKDLNNKITRQKI